MNLRRGRAWTGAALFLFFSSTILACSAFLPEGDPQRPVAVGGTTVVVVFDHAPRELPFNPRNARLVAASQQLEARLGHPVQLQFDAALLPQWVDNFENGLASGIENIVQGLEWLQRTHPRINVWAAPRLLRIACHYDAAARFSKATFDDLASELRVETPALPPVKHSVQANAAPIALLDADHIIVGVTTAYYGPYLERRFAAVAPEVAPAGELETCWDYLDRRHSGFYRRPFGEPRPDLAHDPRATDIELAARFEPRVAGDPQLATKVRARLVEGAHFFSQAYMSTPYEVQRAPAGSPFRRAEATYAAWLQRNAAQLEEAQQIELVRAPLFIPQTGLEMRPPGTPRFFEGAFPGFDALDYVLGVADQWISAGHPSTPEDSGRRSLFQALLCPIGRTSQGRLSTGGSCDSFFYHYLQATPSARDRFLKALSVRHDRPLTETTFFHLLDAPIPDLLEMWRAIEPDPIEWRIATLTFADPVYGGGDLSRAFYDESVRLWRQHPDRRGTVLYLLASLEQYNMVRDGLVNWTEFDRIFGAKISAAEYASFLAQGPLAILRTAGLWNGLGAGFSRVQPLLPLLDAYVADPNLKGYDLGAPERPLLDLAHRLCAEHAAGDLALLHAYFEKRAAARPSEERRFGLMLDVSSPGRCEVAAHVGRR